MEQLLLNPLSEATQALRDGKVDSRRASTYLDKCIDNLLHIKSKTDIELEDLLQEHLPVIEQLISLLPDTDVDLPYYRSIVAMIRSDYQSYLMETEHFYAKKSAKISTWLDYSAANQYFVSIVTSLPVLGSRDEQIERKIFRTHRQYSEEYFPESAFDLYCKFLASRASDTQRLKLLRDVLKKDAQWTTAWLDIGDIYYSQKNYQQALDAYQKAMEDKHAHSAALFFAAAVAAGQCGMRGLEAAYYERCLDYDPEYPCAQRKLGWALNHLKRYEEAEPYLWFALEHDEDQKKSARELFRALDNLKRSQDLLDLVQKYPGHFRTKHYRERVAKALAKDASIDMERLEKLLQTTTTNEHAGAISVSAERSGIELYEHQRDAIQALEDWKRRNSGAGLLVLPTGGGKTLTATYWLMEDILNKGDKVLWIAHRHELLEQALHAFERVSYQDLSPQKKSYKYRVISGQHDRAVHIKSDDDILIASKGSLAHDLTHIQHWFKENRNHVCVIIDEAHHAAASEYRKLIETLKEYGGDSFLLGLTATPFRTAEKEQGLLGKLFPDDILHKTDLRTLIGRGILSEPVFRPIETNIRMADWFHEEKADELLDRIINDKRFDFDSPGAPGQEAAKLIAAHSERNRLIVDTYANNRETYGKTLIFAINREMAVVLNALLQERGIRSDYVISDLRNPGNGIKRTSERNREVIQKFRDGELDVLVNVNILTEGTDLPQVQSVFLTRPTKSTILMTQMIGRALRGQRAGGTEKAYIVSFVDDWSDHIAWVNPEKLYIDTNVDFDVANTERTKYAIRLISIAKLEEFARLADDNLVDELSEQFTFLERIPVGLYEFDLTPNGEGEIRNCAVLVYDCMQDAYRELMDWMERADLSDLNEAAAHADEMLFSERDRLLGYQMQDIADMLAYYKQTGAKPQWIALDERKEYDVSLLARNTIHMDGIARREYLDEQWNSAGGKWTAFFGYQNYKAFREAVKHEEDRLIYPEEYSPPTARPLTQKEVIQIQALPLEEIRRRYPEIGERLRDAVLAKSQDADGYYVSAMSGYRSKNKADFQIDHIKPMSRGGQTTLDNLQLLTTQENGKKSDKWQE